MRTPRTVLALLPGRPPFWGTDRWRHSRGSLADRLFFGGPAGPEAIAVDSHPGRAVPSSEQCGRSTHPRDTPCAWLQFLAQGKESHAGRIPAPAARSVSPLLVRQFQTVLNGFHASGMTGCRGPERALDGWLIGSASLSISSAHRF